MSKLTPEQVKSIPEKYKTMKCSEIAKEFGVHEGTIGYWIGKLRKKGYEVPNKRSISLI